MSNTRTITVVSTKNGRITKFVQNLENFEVTVQTSGKSDKTINTSEVIKTWGGLRDVLSSEGYDLSNLKPTENINKTTLEHIDAVLPDGDFRVFLRPSKTKSGNPYANMGFKDLRAKINELGEEAKAHLSNLVPGKNWTQLTTDELRKGLTSFTSNSSNSAPQVTEVPKEEVAQVTEDTVSPTTNKEKAEQAKSLLNGILDNTDCDDLIDRVESAIEEIDGVISEIEDCGEEEESNDEPESEEAKAKRLEEEEIAREARELEEGF